jgi:hypothetical protein
MFEGEDCQRAKDRSLYRHFSFSSSSLSKQQQTKEEKRREDLIALCTHQGRERRDTSKG